MQWLFLFFFILNKNNKEILFEKSFLLADIKPDIVFEIFFLIINNVNIDFQTPNI